VSTRFRYLRQSLTITGFGTPTFDAAITSVQDVYDIFQRQFADGKLEGWTPSKFGRHKALDMSNRYFTPKRDAPEMEHVPFDKLVDPHGILENMVQSGYVHGEENIVHYFIREAGEDGVQQ
jgi:hypothetical protein